MEERKRENYKAGPDSSEQLEAVTNQFEEAEPEAADAEVSVEEMARAMQADGGKSDSEETGIFDSETNMHCAEIRLPKGIKIGHGHSERTGVTVILAEKGCVAGVDCRGGAPGTRETDLLKNEKSVNAVNAIVLTGGSAYGLESACGVMEYLREKGIGYKMGSKVVPIVPAAVLYDLHGRDYHYPDKAMGYQACMNAKESGIEFGSVGAGRGATVGKIRGVKYSTKGGIGGATVKINGVTVTAVVAVNAFGDVYDHRTNAIIAGAHNNKGAFSDMNSSILRGDLVRLVLGTNTTIGCIITDAKLTKVQANKLASIGHNGYARSIRPVHTDYDGDTLFALATGKKRVMNFAFLSIAAVEAVSLAIENAFVKE